MCGRPPCPCPPAPCAGQRKARSGRSGQENALEHIATARELGIHAYEDLSLYKLGPRALGLDGREIGRSALRAAAALSYRTWPCGRRWSCTSRCYKAHGDLSPGQGGRPGCGGHIVEGLGVGGRPLHGARQGHALLAEPRGDRRTVRAGHRVPHPAQPRPRRRPSPRTPCRSRGGLAIDRGECCPHLGCVGLAPRGPDGPIGAISVVGDGRSPVEFVAPLVVNALRAVSEDLFGAVQPYSRTAVQPYRREVTDAASR
jgi:hypothetical protein